jgi:hypothetical protein
MSDISLWSKSQTDNQTAPPDGFPSATTASDGTAPSDMNDGMREVMGAFRRWYDDREWINLGDTPSFATTSSFTLAGDKTSDYHIGRRIKAFDASTLYGTITDITYSANTLVTVDLDSGELAASLTSVAVSIFAYNTQVFPRDISSTAAYASKCGTSNGGDVSDLTFIKESGIKNTVITISDSSSSTYTGVKYTQNNVKSGERFHIITNIQSKFSFKQYSLYSASDNTCTFQFMDDKDDRLDLYEYQFTPPSFHIDTIVKITGDGNLDLGLYVVPFIETTATAGTIQMYGYRLKGVKGIDN